MTYDFLRDFAAPIATILASITAASIAFAFGLYQARIARRQATIAGDKLALDLFERRVTALNKLRGPISDIVRHGASSAKIENELLDAIEAARFLYGPEVKQYLDDLYKSLLSLDEHNKNLDNDQLSSEGRIAVANQRSRRFQEIVSFYNSIDPLFGPYLQVGHIKFSDRGRATNR
jgi:hypothetical protein